MKISKKDLEYFLQTCFFDKFLEVDDVRVEIPTETYNYKGGNIVDSKLNVRIQYKEKGGDVWLPFIINHDENS